MKRMKKKIIFLFIIIGLIFSGYWLYDNSGLGGPKLGLQDVIRNINEDIEKLKASNSDKAEILLKGRELEHFRKTLDDWDHDYFSNQLNGLKLNNVVFIDAASSTCTDRIYTLFISRYKWNVRDNILSYAVLAWDNTLLYINAPYPPRESIRTIEYDMGNGYYISLCVLPISKDMQKQLDALMEAKLSIQVPEILKKLRNKEKLTPDEKSEYDRIRNIYTYRYLELNLLGSNVIKYSFLDSIDFHPFLDEEG